MTGYACTASAAIGGYELEEACITALMVDGLKFQLKVHLINFKPACEELMSLLTIRRTLIDIASELAISISCIFYGQFNDAHLTRA